MSQAPNIVLLITDQHRADHLGCYGNPIVRTPNIDRLAASGWLAESFHVATPICMPNRASLMTGRMPSRHGVRHNGIELPFDERTLPQALREAGYATAHVGKSHLQNIETKPPGYPQPGEAPRVGSARREGPGLHGQEIWKRWEDDPQCRIETPYYGFDTVDLCIHHADEAFGDWRRWLRAQRADADQLIGPENALPSPEYQLSACRQAWRTRVPEHLYPTHWIAERTVERIAELSRRAQPFFLHCSFPDPHHPFTPPGRFWDMYRPEAVAPPASFHAPHRNSPPHLCWLHAQRDAGTAVKNTQALFACTEREAREAIALNYGSISFIDEAVGRIVQALHESGCAGDTLILFTSDHGDFMGDHQLLLKGPLHYRGLTRVPFIWHDPQRPQAARSAALAQTIDIAPTLLERAGAAPWHGIQGQSLLPLIEARSAAHRPHLVIEEEGQRYYLGMPGRVRMRSLLTAQHRLSVYDGVDWGELYDLEADPDELHNLWGEPAAAPLRAQLTEQMVRAMIALSDTSPVPSRIA